MPFDGAGNFKRAYNWVADAANAALDYITPSRMDGDANDLALGLSNCVTRDGQGMPLLGIDLTRNLSQIGNIAQALGNLGFASALGAKGHITLPTQQGTLILNWNTVGVTTDQAEFFDKPYVSACFGAVVSTGAALTDGVYQVRCDSFGLNQFTLRPRYANQNGAGVFTGGLAAFYMAIGV